MDGWMNEYKSDLLRVDVDPSIHGFGILDQRKRGWLIGAFVVHILSLSSIGESRKYHIN